MKLEFDDVSERDVDNNCIFFDEILAKKIQEFVNDIPINSEKSIYIHCDAGVSRSGAVGYILNEYFNKYLNHFRKIWKHLYITKTYIINDVKLCSCLH